MTRCMLWPHVNQVVYMYWNWIIIAQSCVTVCIYRRSDNQIPGISIRQFLPIFFVPHFLHAVHSCPSESREISYLLRLLTSYIIQIPNTPSSIPGCRSLFSLIYGWEHQLEISYDVSELYKCSVNNAVVRDYFYVIRLGLCGYDILATRTRPVPVSLYPYPYPRVRVYPWLYPYTSGGARNLYFGEGVLHS